VARVYLFFSFKYNDICYLCVLVHWFSTVGEAPDEETTMWMVEPDYMAGNKLLLEVIHLDMILQGAHLIGIAGHTPSDYLLSQPKIDFLMALDLFKSFYSLRTIMPTRLLSNKIIISYLIYYDFTVIRVRRSERGKRVAKALAVVAVVWKQPGRDISRGRKGWRRGRAGSRKEKGW
jgi:hypothetical protein